MVYLIVSNSYQIRLEELQKIFKSFDDVEYIDYNEYSLDEIINICGYSSLFGDCKSVIVRNFNLDKDVEKLEKYIEKPNPSTKLVLLANDKLDERKKVIKLLKDKNNYIYIKPLTYKDINQRLIKLCKEKGYLLSDNNSSIITFASLSNYDIAIQELNKVLLYYNKPCEIKKIDLDNLISNTLDDNNFKFVDLVIKKDIKKALDYIKSLKLLKIEPIALLSLLTREYRLMLITKDLLQKGYSNIKIIKELSLQDWQLNKIITNTYNYSIRELEDKLLDLEELDFQLKTSKIDKYLGLEMFILKG